MGEKIYDVYNQRIELTDEQQACLKYTGERTLMVKGYAGAGKSLVLMALAKKFIMENANDTQNKLAFFTFQNTLVSTMREFLRLNGELEDQIIVSTINSYIYEIYTFLAKNGQAPIRKYPDSGKWGDEQRRNNVTKALSIHKSRYGTHRFHSLDPQFWVDEIDWMKNMNVWREDLEFYLSIPRRGRGGRVRMSASDRVTAYQIYLCYCDYLDMTGQGDWADQALYIVRHPELIPEDKKFEHILIDEAQDLSFAQMTVALYLYKTDMTIAMDMNQRIHSRYWTPKLLGIDTTTKSLTKSMRTTMQIEALAESIRSKNDAFLTDDDKSVRVVPERAGKTPKIVHLVDQAAERKYVVELTKAYVKDNPNLTIGIIAAMNKQIKIYSEWLSSEAIPHEVITKDTTFSMSKPGVKLVSAYGAKGLEFNCVIIPMFAEGYFPFNYFSDDEKAVQEFLVKMRNLVYVAMTRAKNLLTITFWGNNGSRFIREMDPDKYVLEGDPLRTNQKEQPGIYNQYFATNNTQSLSESLVEYLKNRDCDVIDMRDKGGVLWLVGDKSLDSIVRETRKAYGVLWTYNSDGGKATNYKSAWFTKSTK